MIKRIEGSLFAKLCIVTFFLTSLCCLATYGVIAWLVPRTYSTTLDAGLDHAVKALLAEAAQVTPQESGRLFDEFVLNQNGALVRLYDPSGREIALPSQGSPAFPVFVTTGVAAESADPAAYRAVHRYIFTFAGSEGAYTLAVAGSAQQVDLLKDALGGLFCVLLLVVLPAAVLAALVYSRSVTGPVLRISDAARRMAELDLNWQCPEGRADELGTLARSLNEMSRRLRTSLDDLQRANEKLQADIARERALEQAQLDFFSAVSHELKTPLTVLKGQTEGMILNIGAYRDRSKYLARSLEVVHTMETMVQEILTVSRIRSSQAGLKKERVPFSEMLRQEYALFEDWIVQKGLTWKEDVAPGLSITGDRALLQKVVNNLVSNAVAYSPEGGTVRLTAFAEEGAVCFSLENTGVSIPDPELPKLFDAFYRVDPSRSKGTGGSGLGLYIVKTILDQHRAEYRIENTKDGVLFTIRF